MPDRVTFREDAKTPSPCQHMQTAPQYSLGDTQTVEPRLGRTPLTQGCRDVSDGSARFTTELLFPGSTVFPVPELWNYDKHLCPPKPTQCGLSWFLIICPHKFSKHFLNHNMSPTTLIEIAGEELSFKAGMLNSFWFRGPCTARITWQVNWTSPTNTKLPIINPWF